MARAARRRPAITRSPPPIGQHGPASASVWRENTGSSLIAGRIYTARDAMRGYLTLANSGTRPFSDIAIDCMSSDASQERSGLYKAHIPHPLSFSFIKNNWKRLLNTSVFFQGSSSKLTVNICTFHTVYQNMGLCFQYLAARYID